MTHRLPTNRKRAPSVLGYKVTAQGARGVPRPPPPLPAAPRRTTRSDRIIEEGCMYRRPHRRHHLTALAALAMAALLPALAPAPAAAAKKSAVPAFFYSDKPSVATYKAESEAELKQAQAALDRMVGVKGKRTLEHTLGPDNE